MAAGLPANALAQRTLAPRLQRIADRDTSVLVWLIARPRTDLQPIADAVTAAGGRVRHRSRFVHAVSAVVPARALRILAARADVRRVQEVGVWTRRTASPFALRPSTPSSSPFDFRPSTAFDTLYGSTPWPWLQLRAFALHGRGLRGAGVRIAMLDAGFNTLHPFMAGAQILAQRDFVYGDSVVRDQPGEAQGEMSHGTQTWSLLAANAPGVLFGMAPAASYILAKTEFGPTETRAEEDRWVAALEWADSIGVDIVSSSLGYRTFDDGSQYLPGQLTGDFAVTTIAADSAAARGILVVTSVGNSGPGAGTLDTPADADSVVAVGATDSLVRVMAFSSRGPTADGRIKPDVVAPGSLVPVARTDSGVTLGSGTSFAAPLIAGLAALVQETRLGQSAIGLRRGLIDASSRRFTADNTFGYGIPDGLTLYAFPTGLRALGVASGLLGTVTPTFAWDAGTPPPGEGPNVYRVRIGTDSILAGPFLLDTTIASTTLTLPVAAPARTTLYWRVIAASTVGVVESTTVRGPLAAPDWVTLLSFASPQGQSIRDSVPVFAWRSPAINTPPGPFVYDVYVYPSSRGPAQSVAVGLGLTDTTFVPARPLEKNLPFRWRVVAHAGGDSVVVTSPGTFIVIDESAPAATVLFQNFPNPFPNAALGVVTTCIWFDVAVSGAVRLEIFDLRGRLIRRLAPSQAVPAVLPAGRYGRPPGDATGTCDPLFQWDGRDLEGRIVRPGVYVYRLLAPGFRESRRVVFLGPQ